MRGQPAFCQDHGIAAFDQSLLPEDPEDRWGMMGYSFIQKKRLYAI